MKPVKILQRKVFYLLPPPSLTGKRICTRHGEVIRSVSPIPAFLFVLDIEHDMLSFPRNLGTSFLSSITKFVIPIFRGVLGLESVLNNNVRGRFPLVIQHDSLKCPHARHAKATCGKWGVELRYLSQQHKQE